VATAWNVTFPTVDSVLVNVAEPSLAVVALPTVVEPPSPTRSNVMDTPVKGVLLLTSVAMRVNDWLTVASAGPVKVSVGLMPVTFNGSVIVEFVEFVELLEGGGEVAIDEGAVEGELPGVADASGDGDGEGDGVGCAEGEGEDVADVAWTVMVGWAEVGRVALRPALSVTVRVTV
jgi:hypothetical protein